MEYVLTLVTVWFEGPEWVESREISDFLSCQCEGELEHHSVSVLRPASQNLYISRLKINEKVKF